MRLPVTINRNVLATYNYVSANRKVPNLLQSDNLTEWDENVPKSLQEICLDAISENWGENPILDEIPQAIDRCLLLNIISTRLPLNLTVPKIGNDIYWKRCYVERWPKLIPRDVTSDVQIDEIVKSNSRKSSDASLKSKILGQKTWKMCFLEMHLKEYLEKLKPEEYDAEKIKELADLCGGFVRILNIGELRCAENSPSRVPLNAILTGLENLSELSICFKQTYVGEKFRWDTVKTALQDVKLLAKGLEKCKLTVFRVQNSDIDGEKARILLKSLIKHEHLQIVDFSHCRISNEGAIALSKFSLINPVSVLILTNNRIGEKGIESLCYAICKNPCNVKTLDLKLNPVNDVGGKLLMDALKLGARTLERVYLNGCGLKSIATIGEMIENNSILEHLDLSNNTLGEDVGKSILQGLKYNSNLKKLDVRMCKLNPKDEFEILEKINENRKHSKKPVIIEPNYDFEISPELRQDIERVFEKTETVSETDSVSCSEIDNKK